MCLTHASSYCNKKLEAVNLQGERLILAQRLGGSGTGSTGLVALVCDEKEVHSGRCDSNPHYS